MLVLQSCMHAAVLVFYYYMEAAAAEMHACSQCRNKGCYNSECMFCADIKAEHCSSASMFCADIKAAVVLRACSVQK